jgi:hypothetical protein
VNNNQMKVIKKDSWHYRKFGKNRESDKYSNNFDYWLAVSYSILGYVCLWAFLLFGVYASVGAFSRYWNFGLERYSEGTPAFTIVKFLLGTLFLCLYIFMIVIVTNNCLSQFYKFLKDKYSTPIEFI